MQTSAMEARVLKALEENSLEVFRTRDLLLQQNCLTTIQSRN